MGPDSVLTGALWWLLQGGQSRGVRTGAWGQGHKGLLCWSRWAMMGLDQVEMEEWGEVGRFGIEFEGRLFMHFLWI